ncbi:MAG: CoA-binding protein [Flavobacteriales bacterium]|nr:CoA-binding protein [Flavobacteriales bacterium]MBK7940838.1 CoA-binding protein [Flavobacteriales bacterium]MBK8948518.1 CoA-binding protein [Flavobacteriales bacterium]MBK9700743.1 CoA-binding protein [Flavobacteriales bacterium]
MQGHPTLVLGASPKPDRYSNRAVRRLLAHGHPVMAVGARAGHIGDELIRTDIPEGFGCHTVTLYLNAHHQQVWHDRLLALSPRRIIFNPGAENHQLAEEARRRGIEVVEGCTLVMLAAGTY